MERPLHLAQQVLKLRRENKKLLARNTRLLSIFPCCVGQLRYNQANVEKATLWGKWLRGEMTGDPAELRAANPKLVWVYDSLRDRGMVNPIIVFGLIAPNCYDFEVRVGHQRLACARALGWTHVQCVVANGREDVEAVIEATYHRMVWNEEKMEYESI